jgi:hypothetical protein
MPKKIDPLNKKNYGAVTAALTVADVKVAVDFYQKAFGFVKRGLCFSSSAKWIRLKSGQTEMGHDVPVKTKASPW